MTRSAGSALICLCLTLAGLAASPARAAGGRVDVILFGDWGAPLIDKGSTPENPKTTRIEYQRGVARAMAVWVKEHHVRADAFVLLGDNFYGLLKGTDDPRFRENFSRMYPREIFPAPFYFVLGNHDYEDGEHRNWQHEMEYTGDDRWRAPAATKGATWARLDLPENAPLVSLFLLNNVVDGVNRRGKSAGYLGWKEEVAWVASELARPKRAPWLAAASHYPPYSNGAHHKDDGPKPATGPWFNDRPSWDRTRGDLLPLFARAGINFWFGGHDHNLQHLTHQDWPGLDVLVSGDGGGTTTYARHPLAPKEPLLIRAPGWLHMRFTSEKAAGTFWYLEGHAMGGKTGTLKSGGRFERVREAAPVH